MMSKQLVMARVLKKDHEANLQITKQFADMVKEYDATADVGIIMVQRKAICSTSITGVNNNK